MNADSIKIETAEDGFHLIVETDAGERFDFRLLDAEALYNHVKAEIGPWLYERDRARLAFLCAPEDVDESAGAYELSDPKHPRFHSVHVDLWDARGGK